MKTPKLNLEAPRAKQRRRALKLDVGALKVETFDVYAEDATRGTVVGLEFTEPYDGVCIVTAFGGSCFSCPYSCDCYTAVARCTDPS